MTQTTGRTSTEERALQLLGAGYSPEIVASAVGVTASRISQLVSDENFAAEVAELRFKNLQKHNELDSSYDEMETKLATQLKDLLPLMMRPMEVLKAIQTINSLKRRGQSAPESIINQNTVINLTMPTKIIQKFQVNVNNQVISTGTQDLLTVQSGQLEKLADSVLHKAAREKKLVEMTTRQENGNVQTITHESTVGTTDSEIATAT